MNQLIKFINIMRKLGFNVGTDEIIVLTNSLSLINPTQEQFKNIVRSFLVKDQRDFAFFDNLFEAYFCQKGVGNGWDNSNKDANEADVDLFELAPGGSADGKGLAVRGAGGQKHKLSHLVTLGRYEKAGEMVEEALGRVRDQMLSGEELLAQAKLALDWHMEQYQLEKMKKGQPAGLAEKWEQGWHRLEQKLAQGVIRELLSRNSEDDLEEISKLFDLKRKSLNKLSESEYQVMKREVIQLGRKLATRKNRQWRKSKLGAVDLKNTVRNCLQGGGVPLKLYRRRHKIAKPNIILLCDVSSSVVNYSAFMLMLVYSMEQSYQKISSFIFVDDLEDVSPYFSKYGIEDAVELLAARATCSTSGFSDFGRVFKIFTQQHLELLTPKTNLLILGDAKNNYRSPEIESFIKMAQSCHRVWWLNPQPKNMWGHDDSVIAEYGKYCTELWECSDLQQLKEVAAKICK